MCDPAGGMSSRKSSCWIVVLTAVSIVVSLTVTACMMILSYPGDECLLFVGVRGEALIYGNPSGCHFIAYGHIIVVLGAIIMLCLLFCKKTKGFVRRNNHQVDMKAASAYGSPPPSEDGTIRRVARFYSMKPIILALLLSMFTAITALVCLSGYLVTCDELHYETRRQVYGKITLGSPIKQLSINCWSLYRDRDFHTRFHFDHYEFSGQWHGQYRGYKHGRVHTAETEHEHLIAVAEALEISLSGAWISSALWIAIMSLMIHLRRRSRRMQIREIAESMEDAKNFAASSQQFMMDPGYSRAATASPNTMALGPMMTLGPHSPVDLASAAAAGQPYSVSVPYQLQQQHQQPVHRPDLASPQLLGQVVMMGPQARGSDPVLQQQILSQQQVLTQQMQQMQLLQQQYTNNGGGSPVPVLPAHLLQQQQVVAAAQTLQQYPVVSVAGSGLKYFSQPVLAAGPQISQQPVVGTAISTDGVQYVQLSNGVLVSSGAPVPASSQQVSTTAPAGTKSLGQEEPTVTLESSSGLRAQKRQISLSKDAGLKCSRI